MQLQSQLESFHAAGLGVVGLTYDKPALQDKFIRERGIRFPFLSDINAESMKTLGILDENYQPGDEHYGIPYPGIFILDANMRVVGKIFVKGYEKRVNAVAVLDYALDKLDQQE